MDALNDKKQKELIENNKVIKICVGEKGNTLNIYDASLELPATLTEINSIVENTVAKKNLIKIPQFKLKITY